MDKVDLAYIAGIIDGEGSITLTNYNKGNGTRFPVVAVDSVDRELIDWLLATVGSGSIVTKKKYQDHHKQAHTFRLTRGSALELLQGVLPYLRINRKRERASMLVNEYVSLTPRNGKYTEEMSAAKQEFVERFEKVK